MKGWGRGVVVVCCSMIAIDVLQVVAGSFVDPLPRKVQEWRPQPHNSSMGLHAANSVRELTGDRVCDISAAS